MQSVAKHILFVALAATIMSLSGQTALNIPGLDVPITWQSMLVILLPLILPRWDACLGIALFLVLGAFGAPVFANGSGGVDVFLSPSGGYLLGFLCMAIVIALLKPGLNRKYPLRPFWLFPALHVGLSLLGILWIMVFSYGDVSLATHFLPYTMGIIIKSYMAWGLFVMAKILLSDLRTRQK